MVVKVDFAPSGADLVWVDRDDLVLISSAPDRFRTPDKFLSSTLVVFINGVRVEQSNDDGFVIVDDETFELTDSVMILPNFRVSVGYVKKEG